MMAKVTRQVRIEEEIYRIAKIKAAEEGKTLSTVLTELLKKALNMAPKTEKPKK